MQEVIEEINKEKENVGDVPKKEKKERKLFMSDGRPFNINEPKLDFTLNDGSPSEVILTLQVTIDRFHKKYKHFKYYFINVALETPSD